MTTTPDLTALTDAERQILALLAEGHTAKSIAVETGRSEGAVNERLREARRKTGVGSSRELARLLRAQEKRDEHIGMGEGAPPAPALAHAPIRVRWQRVLIMTIILGGLLAAAALLAPGQQAATRTPTATAQGDEDAAKLRAAFDAETRDPAWAAGAEAGLYRRYRAVGGADLATLSIVCRASLCAVHGQSVSPVETGRGKRIADALADPALRRAVPGLHADVTNTGSFTRNSAYYVEFDAIWRRTTG